MRKILILQGIIFVLAMSNMHAQTVIPNAGFEDWTTFSNYSDPTGWDTPNEELMAIPFFGTTVVTKSTDHHGNGSYSARLETKHITLPPVDVPGFMTCGKLTVNLTLGTYTLTGGVPVVDEPCHLVGFYKYIPKGGDSCAIGIGLTKTTGTVVDTIGYGAFSTKDTVNDWTPFSAWIDYISTDIPDTMNIVALSTAQEVMTPGTVLFVDELGLDYITGFSDQDPSEGIRVYNDRETNRLMVFFDFPASETTGIRMFDMRGQCVYVSEPGPVEKDRRIIRYGTLNDGVYLLEILHNNKRFTKKYFLNQ
jgi:hypothetical protein